VQVEGTPLAGTEPLDPFEFVRTVAVARITMPSAMVRLSAGREQMDDALQALCFLAGANSIFYGDKPYIPQVEDAIWREFRCQSGGRNAPPARRVA
jgi:biotin synthase-like enzyme